MILQILKVCLRPLGQVTPKVPGIIRYWQCKTSRMTHQVLQRVKTEVQQRGYTQEDHGQPQDFTLSLTLKLIVLLTLTLTPLLTLKLSVPLSLTLTQTLTLTLRVREL